jgi:hypothetical protein
VQFLEISYKCRYLGRKCNPFYEIIYVPQLNFIITWIGKECQQFETTEEYKLGSVSITSVATTF